jgi:hypothetical protein
MCCWYFELAKKIERYLNPLNYIHLTKLNVSSTARILSRVRWEMKRFVIHPLPISNLISWQPIFFHSFLEKIFQYFLFTQSSPKFIKSKGLTNLCVYIYKRIHHATGVTRLEQAAVLEKIHHGRKKPKKHDTPIESGDSNSSLYIDGGFYFEK